MNFSAEGVHADNAGVLPARLGDHTNLAELYMHQEGVPART
jgi:hypothetical protein